MGSTPVCTISATGISRPTLADVIAYFEAQFRGIYGDDVYLGSDSQDGELVGLLSAAIDDANAMAVQAYNAFSPATAQGTGLASVVKINGLKKAVPSYSTAPMLVVGEAGLPVVAGLVGDELGNAWALPDPTNIPNTGQIVVTAVCQTVGAVLAPSGTISTILNPQPGWDTASNTADATPGNPVETDAQLRIRQSVSTMNSSTGILQGVVGAVAALPGVSDVAGFENEGDVPDALGLPGHTISLVVDGGDMNQIASTIKSKKGGCGTYGSTSVYVAGPYGVGSQVNFFYASRPIVTVTVTIRILPGFTTDVEALIQSALAAYVAGLRTGSTIQQTRLYAPAYLNGAAQSSTYEVQSLTLARDGQTTVAADVAMNFFERPLLTAANVAVIVSNP